MYAATKGFVTHLANGIGHELFENTETEVSCYCPASIETNMTDKFSKKG